MEKNQNIDYFNYVGCNQMARFARALHANYIKIDERGFNDKLGYALGLSKLLKYYDGEGNEDGDWSAFLNDEAIILAAISFIKPAELEHSFKNNVNKVLTFRNVKKKIKYIERCYNELFAIARRIDFWFINLKDIENFRNEEVKLRNEIANLIETKLAKDFQRFKAFVLGVNQRADIDLQFDFKFNEFSFIWELDGVKPSEVIYQGATTAEQLENAVEMLQVVFQKFYEAIIYLKQKLDYYLNESMGKDNHYPEMALLLSFLRLYEYPQKSINGLTDRYLEYYYDNILKQVKREAVNDELYLTAKLDKEAAEAFIKEGTRFLAKSNSVKNSIHYLATEGVQVNKIQLKKILNVFVARKIDRLNGFKSRVRNIYDSEIPVIDWFEKPSLSSRMAYPTFGEDQEGKGDNALTMQKAEMGWAISSPALHLTEGHRELLVSLVLKNGSYDRFLGSLEDLSQELDCSFKETVSKTLVDSLNLQLSVESGWLDVERYSIIINEKERSIDIKFDLDASVPAVVKPEPDVHQVLVANTAPTLKMYVNQELYVYAYQLYEGLELEQVRINTKVKGMKTLQLYNNVGTLSADAPFFPLGPVPKIGSYFIIGNNEVFNKQLDDIKLDIEWFEVPALKNGFQEYYKDYNMGVDNTSYEVALSVLNEGKWIPEKEEQQVIKLFRSKGEPEADQPKPDSRLDGRSVFQNLKVDSIKLSHDFSKLGAQAKFGALSKRGFLKLELVGPLHAFGHDVYPSIVSDITLENSKTGILKGKTKKDLPLQAFTPQIKSISLDYESSVTISVKEKSSEDKVDTLQGEIFHILPFGSAKVYPNKAIQKVNLLPEYKYQGEMYLGFTEARPGQSVSVLFEMLDEFTISSEEEPPQLEWYYLYNDVWYPLKASSLLKDETNNFLKTGLLEINLPDTISENSKSLPEGYFWIKVCVVKNIEVASRMLSVASQVFKTRLLADKDIYESDYLDKPLPRYSVQRPVKNIKGIRSVLQVLPSFSGISREKGQMFKARVAERLRHKMRAIHCWDYERLVLQEFTQIEKVICLPNMTSKQLNAPGNVLLVVSPFLDSVLNSREPKVSSELLYEIKELAQRHSSPFVKVEVRNPSYERIRIICSVQFSKLDNQGFYLQKLNEDVNNYLNGSIGELKVGHQLDKLIYCSDVITYMRTLPYVERIESFSMVQAARDISGNYVLIDTASEGGERAGLKATKPWSVLVSASQHQFSVVSSENKGESKQAGVDYLELGNDFIINE